MNRFILLLFVALVTFVIVMLAVNPSYVSDAWLYVVGFAGLIGKGIKSFFAQFKAGGIFTDNRNAANNLAASAIKPEALKPDLSKPDSPKPNSTMPASPTPQGQAPAAPPIPPPQPPSQPQPQFHPQSHTAGDGFDGTTLLLLRYSDDGKSTLGLLFVNNQYFSLTLEDTYRKEKVKGETRIPAGTYEIKFRKEVSEKTATYRKRYPEWFNFHLELQNVPNFQYIYIHSGGNYTHTDGCLLVSDSLSLATATATFTNSANTFRRLYEYLSGQLQNGMKVRIVVKDESWLNQVKAA